MKALVAFFIVPATLFAQVAPRISVGPNVQVSQRLSALMHREVLIDADPSDASRLIACAMLENGPGGGGTVVYLSSDGGRTWSTPVLLDSSFTVPETGRSHHSVDPSCAFGAGGEMYYARLGIPGVDLTVFHSFDAGRTWTQSPLPILRNEDRDYIVADQSNSKYRGRVYVYAQAPGPLLNENGYMGSGIALWRSIDGGRTFERPLVRYPSPEDHTQGYAFYPGNSVVLSDGTWAAAFTQAIGYPDRINESSPDARIQVITSPDGGETLNESVIVDRSFLNLNWDSHMPMLAADSRGTVFRDRIYVVWPDLVGDRVQILLAYSADRGKTWSQPRLVNDDVRYRDPNDLRRRVGLMSVAVNRAGVVGVVWQDKRDNKSNEEDFQIRFAASLDGGDTFTKSVPVSERPHTVGQDEQWYTLSQSSWVSNGDFDVYRIEGNGGHTMGLTADPNGVFHPIWIDNRTGIHQAWTGTVTVEGTVTPFGHPELASMTDRTKDLKIEIIGSTFDYKTRRVTARVRLRNVSSATVTGPIKVRALLMTSEAALDGTAFAIGAENGVKGPGAVWDFSSVIPADGLRPGQISKERTLSFEVSPLRPTGKAGSFSYGSATPRTVVHFEGQVLGKASEPNKK